MTVLPLIPRGEVPPRSQAVARRLRALLAEERIPAIDVARALGLSQSKFARRMTGDTPLGIDEIDQICDVLGIRFEWLMTGEGPVFDPDTDPSAGAPTRARTWDLRIKRSQLGAEVTEIRKSKVVEFPGRPALAPAAEAAGFASAA